MTTSRRTQPNIVLILADDMGFSDLGCFGSEISTPNLDQLGYTGIRCTQLYNSARCCPSRASLMTGHYPHTAGIGYMSSDLGFPGYEGHLSPAIPTIAELLGAAGYQSRMVGKWHLGGDFTTDPNTWNAGGPTSPRPIDRGFEEHYGTLAGAGSYFAPHTLIHNDSFIKEFDNDFYYTDEIGRQAARMATELAQEDDPFFLYVAHVAPHWPLQAHEEDIARYETTYLAGWDQIRKNRLDRAIEMGMLSPNWQLSERDRYAPSWNTIEHQNWEARRMAVYAAQIEAMDRSVGRLVEALDDAGVRDDTMIVFISDNGGCAELLEEDGPIDEYHTLTETPDGRPIQIGNSPSVTPGADDTYASYGLPWANASNAPFRFFKHWVHEGGIATPAIINWPSMTAIGAITDEPMHIIDLITTFEALSTTNTDEPRGLTTAGESLVPLLDGHPWTREGPIFWEHEGNRAVRTKEWKLVARSSHAWELYNMIDDRTETHDLASTEPHRVERMASLYDEWAARTGVIEWPEIEAKFPDISSWTGPYWEPQD